MRRSAGRRSRHEELVLYIFVTQKYVLASYIWLNVTDLAWQHTNSIWNRYFWFSMMWHHIFLISRHKFYDSKNFGIIPTFSWIFMNHNKGPSTYFGKFQRQGRDTGGGGKKIDFYHDIICGWPLNWRKSFFIYSPLKWVLLFPNHHFNVLCQKLKSPMFSIQF